MRADFLMKVLLLCIMTMAMDNDEEIGDFDTVYPTSKANVRDDFSSSDNVIQWLADKATEYKNYREWPAMDEHLQSQETRFAAEKVAQKKVFTEMAGDHMIPYESGKVEDLPLVTYRHNVLWPLTKFVKESGENETKAVSQYFETVTDTPQISTLFNQVMVKINAKESFVVKPGDLAFGLGVMMCDYRPTQDSWEISYPAINEYAKIRDCKRQGEQLNKTGDDIIHDLFHYALQYITLTKKKTWIIEDLIKSETMTYGTKTPFEIKLAVNYGKVVAIAPKGSQDGSDSSYFVWRRDGEVVFFNNGVDVEGEFIEDQAALVKIADNPPWTGTVVSTTPLKISDEHGVEMEPTDEWMITRKPYPNAHDLWKMMKERVSHEMWEEIITMAETFFQEKKVRLGRFDIFVPRKNEWYINEAQFPGAAQPMWFPKAETDEKNGYYHYLILPTFNEEKIVMKPESKKYGYKLAPAKFQTTKWKDFKTDPNLELRQEFKLRPEFVKKK